MNRSRRYFILSGISLALYLPSHTAYAVAPMSRIEVPHRSTLQLIADTQKIFQEVATCMNMFRTLYESYDTTELWQWPPVTPDIQDFRTKRKELQCLANEVNRTDLISPAFKYALQKLLNGAYAYDTILIIKKYERLKKNISSHTLAFPDDDISLPAQ